MSPPALIDTSIKLFTPEFYLACSLGGALSCGLTHTFVTPLDLVKCRRQVAEYVCPH